MVRLTNHLNMTIVVDWDVKQTKAINFSSSGTFDGQCGSTVAQLAECLHGMREA